MSFNVVGITGTIGLDERPAIRAMKNTEKGAVDMKNSVDRSFQEAGEKGAASFKSAISGIKDEFGKSSALGQAIKLAAGGGAIAALGLAASKFKELSASISQMTVDAQLGKQSFSDMALKIGTSLPVIGDVAQGILSLSKAALGFDAVTQAAEESTKKIAEWQAQVSSLKQLADDERQSTDRLKLGFRIDNATGPAKEALQAGAAADDQRTSAAKNFIQGANSAGFKFKTPDDYLNEKKLVDSLYVNAKGATEGARKNLDAANATYNNAGFFNLGANRGIADAQTDLNMSAAKTDEIAGQKAKLDLLAGSYGELQKQIAAVNTQENKLTGGAFVKGLELAGKALSDAWDKSQKVALERTNKVTEFKKTFDPTVEYKESINFAKDALSRGEITPAEARLAGHHATEHLRSSIESTFYASKVQAEDVFGKRTVKAADQGQVFDSIDDSCKAMLTELNKIADRIQAPTATTVNVVTWP